MLSEGGNALYEWTAGSQLAFVGDGALGDLNTGDVATKHAISNDGSRVFFTNEAGLYMRDMVKDETILIAGANAVFEAANAEGSLVFFSGQECKVMPNGTTGDLECKVIATDGELIGTSEDGSWVYYVAGNDELFVSHEGVPRRIAVLSGADRPDWTDADGKAIGPLTARVSPNGQYLAFMSQRSLTGYDNTDAVSREPDEEVYLYDAATGRVSCASCNPTGARPHGRQYVIESTSPLSAIPLVGGKSAEWGTSSWLAANVPAWSFTGTLLGSAAPLTIQPRYLSNEGRLFFNSSDALVPKDVNEQEDVYEYEPEGIENAEHKQLCTPASASGSEVYKPVRPYEVEAQKGEEGPGCVSLISSGTSPDESAFLEANETGSDVFFLTSTHLSPLAVEDGDAIYDAHECTTQSPCPTQSPAPPPCENEEECRGAPAPQPAIYGAPPQRHLQRPRQPHSGNTSRGTSKEKDSCGSQGRKLCQGVEDLQKREAEVKAAEV